jgi:putative DNA modification/repair radical SAM protein
MGPLTVEQKLRILADAAKYDASCASSGGKRERPAGGVGNAEGMGICHSYTPDGRCVSLLKILLTNYCLYDCAYCVNRISSDTPRARFTVEEVVTLTMEFYRRNYIEGLFLSSGVVQSADYTMDQLGEVARRLREEHRFGGYIHLKAVAGASPESIQKAGRWADRLSANIELATQQDLNKLAPAKTHAEVERSMGEIRQQILIAKEPAKKPLPFAPAGQSTQMIVGATPTTDAEILGKASTLYGAYGLRRVYYSAFSPIPQANPLLPVAAAPLLREHRLYQADWLIRFYGYKADEITAGPKENLSLIRDPKLDWALRHRNLFPVDVNRAPLSSLLRVPGIGVRNAKRIVETRCYHSLRLSDLAKLRISVKKAQPFVVTSDSRPRVQELDSLHLGKRFEKPQQLMLLEASTTAATGEL